MKLRPTLLTLTACSIWWLIVALMMWLPVRYFGMQLGAALGQGVMVALWPTPGTIRLVRQILEKQGQQSPLHERAFLITLSVLAAVVSLLLHDRWWVLPAAFSVWSFSAIWLGVNSRFGVRFFTRFLGAKPIKESTLPPSKAP